MDGMLTQQRDTVLKHISSNPRYIQTPELIAALRSSFPKFMFYQQFTKHWYVAGGFLRDFFAKKQPKDIDIFFKTPLGCAVTVTEFELSEGWQKTATNKWACTFENQTNSFKWSDDQEHPVPPVQLIIHEDTFGPINEMLVEFDFVCCMIALDPETEAIHWYPQAREDADAKVLRMNPYEKTSNPVRSLRRALDFRRRGWTWQVDECICELLNRIVGYRERLSKLAEDQNIGFSFYAGCNSNNVHSMEGRERVATAKDLMTPIEIVQLKQLRLDELLDQVIA